MNYTIVFFFFLGSLLFNKSFSQVRIVENLALLKTDVVKYDSLNNFIGSDFKKYLGQKISVLPKHEMFHKFGYDNFIRDPNKSIFEDFNIYSKTKFKKGQKLNSTPYDDLVNRTFYIVDIIEKAPNTFFKLKDINSDETLYFNYNYKNSHSFPFVVGGYYEKQKSIYIGKEYYARTSKINHYSLYKQETTDINGIKFLSEVGSLWKIIDVIASSSNTDLQLIFLCEGMDRQIYIVKDLMKEYDIVEKSEYEKIKDLYSKEIFLKILKHNFDIGMDTYLIRLALGNPKRISKSTTANSTTELWVYENGRYLYFNEGKLTRYD